jgi:hypothetical protein
MTGIQQRADTALARIGAQIDLPGGVAVWVLAAHAVALLSPVALMWQTHRHAAALEGLLGNPFLLHVAAVFFLLGSAFEIAQNTADRWYYEGPYPAFSDLLFNFFVAAGLASLALAVRPEVWVVAVVVLALPAFVALYLAGRLPYPAMGVLGVLAVGLLLHALGDPVVLWLLAFATGLNLYLLTLIVRTRAQSLHGGIALCNGLGLLAVPLAIEGGVTGSPTSWSLVGALLVAILLVAALAWPRLSRLAATPRPSGGTGP